MFCCCRQKDLDITSDSAPKQAKPSAQTEKEKEKVFSEAVTAHPSPAATPVTQQPPSEVTGTASQQVPVTDQQPPASQAVAKPVEKPPIVEETVNQTAAKSVDTSPTTKPNISVINVGASEVKKEIDVKSESALGSPTAAARDEAILSKIDSLSQAVDKAAAAGELQGRESCSVYASQLSVLTSQVRKEAGNMSESALLSAVSRLESVATRLESLALKAGGSAGGDSGEVAPFVTAYDDFLGGSFAKFLTLSAAIGGDVKTQVGFVEEAFRSLRQFLVIASNSKQPSQEALGKVVQPVAGKLSAAQDYREKNRRSEHFNHLSAISESIAALGWITVAPAPVPYVKEMKDAGMFYTNRVLKDYKEKDQKHVDWAKAWIATLTELQDYVKQYHTTGVSWNPKGGDATAAAGSAPPPPPGGAPPPPAPPPPPPAPASAPVTSGGDDSRAALFADLSKGEAVTAGLKKVTDDMKTHKNPALRQGPAPFKATAPKPVAAPKPALKAAAKPPLTELQNKKWVVEYHEGNKNIVLDKTELKQTVYVFKCSNSVIQIKGKVNSIILDSCKKTAIVFEDVVSSLEFVNCQSMQGQVTGKVPTISIDKTDGCMVYLSDKSLDVEIVTAKSSEMNVLVPVGDGDYKEFALPEQFKTMWNGSTMVTVQTDSV